MAYTVKQLAQLAGISVRTLHHYDEIGLLTPAVVGANGYRYYDESNALRLQSILFYRELDFPLSDIKSILDRPDFEPLHALQEQRTALEAKLGRLHRLIATLERTIQHLQKEKKMSTKKLFAGFTPEEEARCVEDAARRWDPATVHASHARWQRYTSRQKAEIKAEGEALYRDLLAAMPQGPASAAVQAGVARWHRHLEFFWSPNDAQLLGLANLYNDDPAFRKNYDELNPELAPFLREAVKHYVVQRQSNRGPRGAPPNPRKCGGRGPDQPPSGRPDSEKCLT